MPHQFVVGIWIVTCALATAARGRAQAPPSPEPMRLLDRGAITSQDSARVRRVDLGPGAVWELVLEISHPDDLDLDLYVYGEHPAGGEAEPLCESLGVERIERCRIAAARGPVWAQISPVSYDEVPAASTRYTLRGRSLAGVRLAGTLFTSEEAHPIEVGEMVPQLAAWSWDDVEFGSPRIYALRGGEWLVTLRSDTPGQPLELLLFDGAGRPLGDPLEPAEYQDRHVRFERTPAFAMVRPSDPADTSVSFSIGALRSGDVIPLRLAAGTALVRGTEARRYSLALSEGGSAIVGLEGSADLAVEVEGAAPLPVQRLGRAQQQVLLGDALGRSRHVLGPRAAASRVTIAVTPREDSVRYYRGTGSPWTLQVREPARRPTYLIRLPGDQVQTWSGWWSEIPKPREGQVTEGSLAVLHLPAPPEIVHQERDADARQQQTSRSTRAAFLAELDEGGGELDIAVCTLDGEVLDIGTDTVTWDWPPNAPSLYLVVFPDPFRESARGSSYLLRLARSLGRK